MNGREQGNGRRVVDGAVYANYENKHFFSACFVDFFFSFFYFSQLVAYLSYLLMTDAMGLNY